MNQTANYFVELEQLQEEIGRYPFLSQEVDNWRMQYQRVRVEYSELKNDFFRLQRTSGRRIQELDTRTNEIVKFFYTFACNISPMWNLRLKLSSRVGEIPCQRFCYTTSFNCR